MLLLNPFVAEMLHGLAIAAPTALLTAVSVLWKHRGASARASAAAEERADERTIARYNELAEHDRTRVNDCLGREVGLLARIGVMERRAEEVHAVHVTEMNRLAREQSADREECDDRAKRIRDEMDEWRRKYEWLEDVVRLRAQDQGGKQTPRGSSGPQRKPEGP